MCNVFFDVSNCVLYDIIIGLLIKKFIFMFVKKKRKKDGYVILLELIWILKDRNNFVVCF